MELTRKQLNQITLQLPHPQLVVTLRHPSTIKIPLYESMSIVPNDSRVVDITEQKYLQFYFSIKEFDWILDLQNSNI